ncbi:ORC-CDC6 family AAA ATPase [Sphingobacterium spiritivorum]|uniref:ORC-CDC6 family AAA ATPase n=1 Tax=Sphingobacterium spiritivorum TaxID=258 RepID=UPI003DA2A95F
MLLSHTKNPFQYLTPEQISTDEALNLFVDVFRDYYNILNIGNTFIHGPRGSGKSMMFRIMRPDCQMRRSNKLLNEIDFYSVHIPIKETALNITELQLLENVHGNILLNEYYLVLYFSIKIFDSLEKEDLSAYNCQDEINVFKNTFEKLFYKAGLEKEEASITATNSFNNLFLQIREKCEDLQNDFVIKYLSKLLVGDSNLPYGGPIARYQNFLLPLIKALKNTSFLRDQKFYLLIDDADELNVTQTKILNTWVSARNTELVSFKISTQLKYLTYFTVTGSKIDSPHDYSEITLNQVYTSDQKESYKKNVKEIIEKRLKTMSSIDCRAEDFYPSNVEQDEKVKAIHEELYTQKLNETGDSKKAYDFAYRNARPEYMTRMKNQYTYSYAGFDQLVHLSSGIIRSFLDLSSKMFTSALNNSLDKVINHIPVNIQDKEIKDYSYSFFNDEFEKLLEDCNLDEDRLNKHKRLRNLIDSMGKAFRIILESNSSERRKFSFYYDGNLNTDVKDILKLGIVYGYFHPATLSAKSGLGRSKLYILNRMLSPYYKLDPMSFSGYLYLTEEMINLACNKPNVFLTHIRNKKYEADLEGKPQQMDLFENYDILENE